MADDADTTGQASRFDTGGRQIHASTDRPSRGRSVETTPESLYLWRIAVLEQRAETLQAHVDLREQELQHVIDRYERVLEERATRDGELRTDGGTARNQCRDRSHIGRLRSWLRERF